MEEEDYKEEMHYAVEELQSLAKTPWYRRDLQRAKELEFIIIFHTLGQLVKKVGVPDNKPTKDL